ncbi:MAG: hypothetical protein M3Z01_03470 [Thermoproteota archaeon]|nr:hypothetical protein [Thermoproteota archaeon]
MDGEKGIGKKEIPKIIPINEIIKFEPYKIVLCLVVLLLKELQGKQPF